MGIGAGLLEGVETLSLVSTVPDSTAYISHSGAVYHQQDEGGGGNAPHYEITATGDSISFGIPDFVDRMDEPVLTLYAPWGAVDFDVQGYDSGDVIVSEQSGFDNEVLHVDLTNTEGSYTITNFNTADGVDGTQSGWYPYVYVRDLNTY